MICPECKGQKTCIGLVMKADSCGASSWTCRRCDGLGTVPDEQEQWAVDGLIYRQDRVARHESLLDASDRTGFTPAEVAAMENGRRDPAPLRSATASG